MLLLNWNRPHALLCTTQRRNLWPITFLIFLVLQGGALIRQARRDLEANRFDLTTGLLLPDGVTSSPQSSSVLSGTDPKPSRNSLPHLRQPSPQPIQSVLPQQQNHLTSQQQHRPQPEEGLAGEIDRELAAVMDKSHVMVCLQLYYPINVVGSSLLEFYYFLSPSFCSEEMNFLHKNGNGEKLCVCSGSAVHAAWHLQSRTA